MSKGFETSDLSEILFLMCHNVEISRAERIDGRVIVTFDNSDNKCSDLMRKYLLGQDYVSVNRVLLERQRALRLIKETN